MTRTGNNIQIVLVYTAVLVVYCIGLVKSDLFEDSLVTTKEICLYLSIILMGGLALLRFLTLGQPIFQLNLLDILVFCYLVILPVVHLIFIPGINLSNIIADFSYFSLYFIVRGIASGLNLGGSEVVFSCTVIALSIQIAIAFTQYLKLSQGNHDQPAITGLFSNPGPYAIYISAISASLVFWGIKFIREKKTTLAILSCMLIGFSVMIIIASLSRSAFIGLVLSICLLTLLYVVRSYDRYRKKINYSILIFLLLAVPSAFLLYGIRPQSALGRTLIWKATANMISEAPAFGHGVSSYSSKYFHYQASYLSGNDNETYNYLAGETNFAFNDLLQICSDRGLIGLILFLFIVFYIFNDFRKNNGTSLDHASLLSGIGVIMISGLTSYPLQVIPISAYFWMAIGLLPTSSNEQPRPRQVGILFPIGLMGIFVFFTYILVSKANIYISWKKMENRGFTDKEIKNMNVCLLRNGDLLNDIGNYYIESGEYRKAIPYLERATRLYFDKDFFYSLGFCYESSGQYDAAQKCYKIVQQTVPHLIKPSYLLALSYFNQGRIDEFKKQALIVVSKKPKLYNPEVDLFKRKIKVLLSKCYENGSVKTCD